MAIEMKVSANIYNISHYFLFFRNKYFYLVFIYLLLLTSAGHSQSGNIDGKNLLCTNTSNIFEKMAVKAGLKAERAIGVFFGESRATVYDTTSNTIVDPKIEKLRYTIDQNYIRIFNKIKKDPKSILLEVGYFEYDINRTTLIMRHSSGEFSCEIMLKDKIINKIYEIIRSRTSKMKL